MTHKNTCTHADEIHTTPEKLWEALTTPETTKKYWYGFELSGISNIGSKWKLTAPDGKIHADGEVLELDSPHRIVLTWKDEVRPEMTAEGYSRCVIELIPKGDVVNLSITQLIERDDSKLIALVATSWPKVVSSLKSFLETETK
jgi:uncharacterized protein YndB with AHSA1/START domain